MRRRLFLALLALPWFGGGLLYAQSGELDAYLTRGRALAKAEKAAQALPYFLLALELAETEHGADSPRILPVLEDLADAHAAQAHYRDAEPLYERALEIQEREAARHQSGIARTSNRLGAVYEATGREVEAMALYRSVLTVWASVLGAKHPEVQVAGGRLAKLALRVPTKPGEAAPARPPPTRPAAPAPPQTAAPMPAPAGEPPPARVGKADHLIHLTSIRNPRDAEAEWARLKRLHGPMLEGLELTVTRADLGQPRGVYFRVKGGPLDRAAAKDRCAAFGERGVWCQVVKAGPAAEPAPPVAERRPVAPPDAVAGPPTPMGYRIHLTSIRDAAQAEAEWRRLNRLYGRLLAGLILAVERADLGAPRGVYYRVEGGPLSRQAARDLCATFAAQDVWCRVVPPGGGTAQGMQRLAVQSARRIGPGAVRGTRRPVVRRFRRRADLRHARTLRRDRGCRRAPEAIGATQS